MNGTGHYNGFVTWKALATIDTTLILLLGSVAVFFVGVHTASVHTGAMTIERYDQLHARDREVILARDQLVSAKIESLSRKIDELSRLIVTSHNDVEH